MKYFIKQDFHHIWRLIRKFIKITRLIVILYKKHRLNILIFENILNKSYWNWNYKLNDVKLMILFICNIISKDIELIKNKKRFNKRR
jgi:hypothetical protein